MASELIFNYPGSYTTYCRIHDPANSKVWDVENSAWDTWADGDIDDYDVVMADVGGGVYTGDFPTDIAEGTKVRLVYCRQAGSSPAVSDLVLHSETKVWRGYLGADDLGEGVIDESWIELDTLKDLPGMDEFTDEQLAVILNGAITAVEEFCKRHFKQTTYTKWFNGTGCPRLWVKNVPIISVTRLGCSLLGLANIRYVNATAAMAFVRVTDTAVILTSEVSGSETTTTLNFADYPTVSSIIAAIDAVDNWETTLLSTPYGYKSSDELRPCEGKFTLDTWISLEAPYQYHSEYEVYPETGEIRLRLGSFPYGLRNTYVKYTGGYASGEVPADLTSKTLMLCRIMASNIEDDPTLKSMRLGDFAWTKAITRVATDEIRTGMTGLFDNYRMITI